MSAAVYWADRLPRPPSPRRAVAGARGVRAAARLEARAGVFPDDFRVVALRGVATLRGEPRPAAFRAGARRREPLGGPLFATSPPWGRGRTTPRRPDRGYTHGKFRTGTALVPRGFRTPDSIIGEAPLPAFRADPRGSRIRCAATDLVGPRPRSPAPSEPPRRRARRWPGAGPPRPGTGPGIPTQRSSPPPGGPPDPGPAARSPGPGRAPPPGARPEPGGPAPSPGEGVHRRAGHG
jgi:hypothetical protein